MVTDQGDSIVLVLLDLTAAFDMIDHNIVIAQLKSYVGLTGTVLGWFISYLKDRRISVRLRTHMSSAANLPWGVPQYVLQHFSLCICSLGAPSLGSTVSFHCYTDATQIYLPLKRSDNNFYTLLACMKDIKIWMSLNFLYFNEKKTEIILLWSP